MASIRRFAFLVDLPDVEERKEYATAGEDLTAEEAVERLYKVMPDGASIVKPLRGEIPDDLDLSPPSGNGSSDSSESGENRSETNTQSATSDESDDESRWTEEKWLRGDYQARAATVEAGEVDDHLDAIEDCETSNTVENAVAERREELEAEA